MKSKLINLSSTNNKEKNQLNIFPFTPQCSKSIDVLKSSKINYKTNLKEFYSTKKNYFLSHSPKVNRNQNISPNKFLSPHSITKFKINSQNPLSFLNRTQTKENPLYSFKKIFSDKKQNNKDINNISFLNKKRKYMTSEEIELEKIEKEKTASKKFMEKSRNYYHKSLIYTPMKIIPTPLTTFKPFNLSSNKSSKYLKEGKSNTLYEINKLNQKIRQKMQQKIENLADIETKNQILLNNNDFLVKQNILYNNLFKQPKSINIIDNNNNSIIDENKDINKKEYFKTPYKIDNTENKKDIKLFENLNKSNLNSFIDNQFKKYKENNNIMKYYLVSIKKNIQK